MNGFFDSARAAFLVMEPEEHWVRAQFVVCSECRGRGVIVPTEVDEFNEEFLDQFYEHQDAWTCNHCGGERVMPVPETERGSDDDTR